MTHEQHDELVAGYALDALDAADRRLFEAHLATCAACQAEVAALGPVTASLGLAVTPEAPPAALKARVLSQATSAAAGASQHTHSASEASPPIPFASPSSRTTTSSAPGSRGAAPLAPAPRSRGWLPLAAAVTLAAGASIYAWSLRTQLTDLRSLVDQAASQNSDLRQQVAQLRADASRMMRTVTVMNAPDIVRVAMHGQAHAAGASGSAFFSHTHGLVVSTERLPQLAPGRVYQLWMVMPGHKPVGAGTFQVNDTGTATMNATIPTDLVIPAAVQVTIAITEEPTGGSDGPTTPVVLAGSTR